MKKTIYSKLSMRERQILDVILNKKESTVSEVLKNIPNPPGYSAVRALMSIMEKKGYIKHKKIGLKYIYSSVITPKKAYETELSRLLHTHFNNSMYDAVAAIINIEKKKLGEKDFENLHALIDEAKSERK